MDNKLRNASNSENNESASPQKSWGHAADRHQMIAVAAYFRAEERGFDGGDGLEDWFAAEAEIDAMPYR